MASVWFYRHLLPISLSSALDKLTCSPRREDWQKSSFWCMFLWLFFFCCCFLFLTSIIVYRFSLHNLSIWTQAFSLSSNLHIIQVCSLLRSFLFQNVTYNITVRFKTVQPFNYYWKVRTVSFSHSLLLSWNLCDWLQFTVNSKFYLMIDVF